MSVPNHIAIILDGNGRWAKAKGMPRTYGHTVGAKNVETICKACHDRGVKYLTLYAFSTENWSRPDDEVNALMNLLDDYMKTCLRTAKKNNMRVRVIGDRSRLAPHIQESINTLMEASKEYDGLNMTIAINYGSRDEMIRAMQKQAVAVKNGELEPEDITEESFSKALDTFDIPDPDLMIRTSGELRLSNYLLWQLAYSEFYFTDVPWPDFKEAQLDEAIAEYERRHRRFGGI